MDKKDIIRGAVLIVVLIAAWVGLKFYWQHAHPEWFVPAPEPSAQTDANATTQPTTAAAAAAATTQYASATTQPAGTQPSDVAATGPTTGPAVATASPSMQAGFAVVRATSAEQVR